MSVKNSMTPSGIEPATFQFVAQHLNWVILLLLHEVASRMCGRRTERLEGRHQSCFRKELKRGAGREKVRKQRGKDKAKNTWGRADFGARGKVKKVKRKWSRRGKVKNEQM